MKTVLRRGLVFLLLVGLGLATVLLLADPFSSRRAARVDSLTGADEGGRLRVRPGDGESETQVVFGETDFDVVRSVEIAPGQVEDRVAARVHVLSARPAPNGIFLAQSPTVQMLDTLTGAERGTLSANEARFATGTGTGGSLTLDLSALRAEEWSLAGQVRGSFPLADGRVARLECEELQVHGAVVRGPGQVTWTRDDLALSGLDLSWDDVTGRLTYDSAAHLSLPPTDVRLGLELDAVGGLTWTVPPGAADPEASAYGELRGPVSGTASDGSRLAAQTVLVDGRTGTLTLQGDARLERAGPDGDRTRLAARTITAVTDADRRLVQARAEGGVRLDATSATGEPAWLTTESVTVEGDIVRAPGRVSWNRQAFAIAGDELTWDRSTGRLDLARDAVLAVAEGSSHPWAGLRLQAPGGLEWQAPPGTPDALAQGHGELRGPVTGNLPDGTSLAASTVFCDGPERQLRLAGGASFRRLLRGEETRLDAHEVALVADAEGGLALATAQGEVVVLTGPPGAPRGRLDTDSLQRQGGLLIAPGAVRWSRGDVTLAGTGLTWDEPAGRLDVHRDAQMTLVQADTRVQYELSATGGLTWTVPPGAVDAAAEGRGELRGRVTGHGSDGSTLAANRLLLDGPARTLQLKGAGHIATPGTSGSPPATLEGESLTLGSYPEGVTLAADAPARWTFGTLQGSGDGVAWDGRIGHLVIERDVRLGQLAPDGSPDLTLIADGPLDWTVPPGAADPLREGHGEVGGSVRLQGADRTVVTEHLSVAEPGGETQLRGPSRVEWTGPGGLRLSGEDGITLGAMLDGEPSGLRAAGRAESWLYPRDGGAPLHLAADEIVADRVAQTVELRGGALVERTDGSHLLRASATEHILVRLDEQDAPVWVEAVGDVDLQAQGVQAQGSGFTWDLPADLAQLQGPGRLASAGVSMSFASAEIHPDAERFRIEHSVVNVQR